MLLNFAAGIGLDSAAGGGQGCHQFLPSGPASSETEFVFPVGTCTWSTCASHICGCIYIIQRCKALMNTKSASGLMLLPFSTVQVEGLLVGMRICVQYGCLQQQGSDTVYMQVGLWIPVSPFAGIWT